MREEEARLQDSRTPGAIDLTWRGVSVRVTRRGQWWCVTRDDRVWPGPAFQPGEPWPRTEERIRLWLDQHQVLE